MTMTPQEQAALISWLMSGGQIPGVAGSYDRDGYPQPLEPSDQKGQLDVVYKLNQALSNPITMGMMNPEALGPGAFDPTSELEPLERPGEVMWNDWKSAPDGSVRRWMADAYKDSGFDPGMAFGKFQTFMTTPPEELDETSQGLQQNLRSQLPQGRQYVGSDDFGQPIFEPGPDLNSVNEQLQKMHADRVADPVGNYEEGGVQYNRTETPSELMQAYQQLGLADPRRQFTGEDLYDPEKAAIREALPQVNLRDLSQQQQPNRDSSAMLEQLIARTRGGSRQIEVPNQPSPTNPSAFRNGPTMQGAHVPPHMMEPGSILDGPTMQGTHVPPHMMESYSPPVAGPSSSRPAPPTRQATTSTRLNLPEADRQAMDRAIVDNKNTDSRLRNQRTAAERQINTARDKVYGSGAGDLVAARVNAHNLRRQGVTPFTKQRDEMMAMLRAYGVGI